MHNFQLKQQESEILSIELEHVIWQEWYEAHKVERDEKENSDWFLSGQNAAVSII